MIARKILLSIAIVVLLVGAAIKFPTSNKSLPPVFTDENFDDTDLYFFNSEDVKLHVFRDASPDFDGGESKGMNRAAVLISDSQLIYDVQVLGIYNLRVERRNGTGRMSALVA